MASFGMSDAHKNALRKNRLALVQQLIIDEEFLAVLVQNQMLTDIQKENFDVNKTRNKRAAWVIDYIPKKGPKAIGVFVEALMVTKQGQLADLVAKDLADKWRQEHPDEVDSDSDDEPTEGRPAAGRPAESRMETDFVRVGGGTMETPAGASATAGYQYSHPDGRMEIIKPETKFINIDVPSSTTAYSKRIKKDTTAYGIKEKGMAVIINVKHFDGATSKGALLGTRLGTDVDVLNVKNLFTKIGYTTVVDWSNCNHEQLKGLLEECRASDEHLEADSFVMVILSHGFNGGFYTADSKEMQMKDLVSYFSAARCPNLKDKPKMFFIQACQGNDKTTGVEVPTETMDDDTTSVEKLSQDLEQLGLSQDEITDKTTLHQIIGGESNVFMAFSTVPKYVSIRHESNGTWFIRDLVTVLSQRAHDTNLQNMMTEVIHSVSERRSLRRITQENPNTGKMEEVVSKYVQISFTLDTLPKYVYFLPGIKG